MTNGINCKNRNTKIQNVKQNNEFSTFITGKILTSFITYEKITDKKSRMSILLIRWIVFSYWLFWANIQPTQYSHRWLTVGSRNTLVFFYYVLSYHDYIEHHTHQKYKA